MGGDPSKTEGHPEAGRRDTRERKGGFPHRTGGREESEAI